MNILIIGGGGREHAIAWKAALNPKVKHVYVAPGNAGTARENKISNIDIAAENQQELLSFAKNNDIDLTIVGPEGPLVAGIVDLFQSAGLKIFGPSKAASQLEGSKSFTKDFLARHNIPTANYKTFSDLQPALDYLKAQGAPIVIKADGLAAGKGVVVAETLSQAETAVRDMLSGNRFGDAGHSVVIEEFMQGEEASFIVMVDGKNILPMATSQDHKTRDDGDKGPNTGGMGAYSPAPVVSEQVHARVMREIIQPTVDGMAAEGNAYTGFLYAGLMIATDGSARVVEYNVRLGDPETQPIMLRLQSDFIELCSAALDTRLNQVEAQWDPRVALGVVMAAGGYPNSYAKGDVISGLETAPSTDCKVFHAGTQLKNTQVVTAGGRVLCVTALGNDVASAKNLAYDRVAKIHWENSFYRTDIGYRALQQKT